MFVAFFSLALKEKKINIIIVSELFISFVIQILLKHYKHVSTYVLRMQ